MAGCLFTQSASSCFRFINMSQFVKSWEINGLFRLRSVQRERLLSVMVLLEKKRIYSPNIVDKLGNLLLTGFGVVSLYDLWAKARIKLQRVDRFKLHSIVNISHSELESKQLSQGIFQFHWSDLGNHRNGSDASENFSSEALEISITKNRLKSIQENNWEI